MRPCKRPDPNPDFHNPQHRTSRHHPPRSPDESSAFLSTRSQTQRQGRWSPSRRSPKRKAKPLFVLSASFLVLRFLARHPPTRSHPGPPTSRRHSFPREAKLKGRAAGPPAAISPHAKPNLCSFLVLRSCFVLGRHPPTRSHPGAPTSRRHSFPREITPERRASRRRPLKAQPNFPLIFAAETPTHSRRTTHRPAATGPHSTQTSATH